MLFTTSEKKKNVVEVFKSVDLWKVREELEWNKSNAENQLKDSYKNRDIDDIVSFIEGEVPNIPAATNNTDLIKVHTSIESRNGRTIFIQPLKTGRYQTLRFNSLPFHGARLFNAMSKNVRNATQLRKDAFKNIPETDPRNPTAVFYHSFLPDKPSY